MEPAVTAVSDHYPAAKAGGMPAGSPVGVSGSAGDARVRGRARIAVTFRDGKIRSWAALAVFDLRRAWWTPTSLPTLRSAWEQRIPDRSRVPGDNGVLYGGWLVYNHTIGLLVPAAVVALIGALTPLVWASRHPARMVLAAVIALPLIVLALA